ncbi:MAG: hypothetical protein ABI890_10655 [Lapillicoccus sp.]
MPGDDEAKRAAIARSQALAELGRHDEVLGLLGPLVGSHPDDPELLGDLARAHLRVGGRRHHQQGLELARRAVALAPDDAHLVVLLGAALLPHVTKWDEARALLARGVELAPHDASVHYLRAASLEAMSLVHYDEAYAAVLQAVALAPNDPDALLLKATIEYRRLNPFDDAARQKVLVSVHEVLAIDPGSAEAAYLLAQAETAGSTAQEAAKFHAVVRRDPRHTDAIAMVDSLLVKPLRGAWWTLWLLTGLQAVLLARGVEWGTALTIMLFLFVLAIPWWRFRAIRRTSPPGFGKDDGFDWWLCVFGVLTYLAAGFFKLTTNQGFVPRSLWPTVLLLLLAGLAYLWRSRRRRRRFGG